MQRVMQRGQSLSSRHFMRSVVRELQSLALSFTTAAAEAHTPPLAGFGQRGKLHPQYLPFQLTPEQAKTKFLEWQRSNMLTPSDLLAPGTYQLQALMVPFWLFGAQARVAYRGTVGLGDGAWKETEWRELPVQAYPWTLPRMQVYASFEYRRDFAEVLKGGLTAHSMQPLGEREMKGGRVAAAAAGGEAVALAAPEMRRSMAWEFVLRSIRHEETAAVTERLKSEHGAQEVQDVHIRVTSLSRQVQLAYVPAYMFSYVYGETFNVHGERRAEHFQAVVSGAESGGVAGERHFSAHKASLAAGGGFAALAMASTAVLAPLLGTDPWTLVNIESAFAVFFIGSTAALTARMLPVLMHQRAEEQRMAAENAEFERVVSLGMGPLDSGSDDQEVLRSGAEWRRWEHSDKRFWNQAKRRRWAEELWQSQHRRRRERLRLRQRLHQQLAQQQAEEEREQRRERRWGCSSHHSHFRQQQIFSGGRQAGGRKDYLGYYDVLGLDGMDGGINVSQEDIKKAFRQAALRWHPDKHRDELSRRNARHRFHLIRLAYETLRDPDKRKAYDSGKAPID